MSHSQKQTNEIHILKTDNHSSAKKLPQKHN